ncbi:hypothetical protein F5Y11DRAFT_113515 [Daldinia sp. FL1419]|nr:hypothetical protein F5Y11DRAFT_113515 [Daldinia sp. FL1419]
MPSSSALYDKPTKKLNLKSPKLASSHYLKMCQYITHSRTCYLCGREEIVLISEKSCTIAASRGVFGSCGRDVSNKSNRTRYQCWKCKEESDLASRTQTVHATAP